MSALPDTFGSILLKMFASQIDGAFSKALRVNIEGAAAAAIPNYMAATDSAKAHKLRSNKDRLPTRTNY
ncbi:hypothetical protein RJ640_009557 [Escallonia rubra]|uniref:DUF4005 domain-containing protein n=1 Tax=Escallonia rubra TaxID=112253 RepID=A0AA88U0E7_9ASTE|nr:hypothetical protein RJ640_009557 [Escallonia rubra]